MKQFYIVFLVLFKIKLVTKQITTQKQITKGIKIVIILLSQIEYVLKVMSRNLM